MAQEALVNVQNLKKHFTMRTSIVDRLRTHRERFVRAVDGVDFRITKGDIFALVGESGSGKTTVGKLLSLLETPTSGSIFFERRDLTKIHGPELKRFRRKVQMIFQDPYESLDPRFTVVRTVSEPLIAHGIGSSDKERVELVSDILGRVGLKPPEYFFHRYPHELSGGQRQRVAVARAMILRPVFTVADEPVSMLDVSIRAGILNLMLRLREELGVAYLFITHDLAVARYMSKRIAIMYLGKIMEMGLTDEVVAEPRHPYTRMLMSAVPIPDPSAKRMRIRTTSEVPNSADVPPGCRFHPRCPNASRRCSEKIPEMTEVSDGHFVACLFC